MDTDESLRKALLAFQPPISRARWQQPKEQVLSPLTFFFSILYTEKSVCANFSMCVYKKYYKNKDKRKKDGMSSINKNKKMSTSNFQIIYLLWLPYFSTIPFKLFCVVRLFHRAQITCNQLKAYFTSHFYTIEKLSEEICFWEKWAKMKMYFLFMLFYFFILILILFSSLYLLFALFYFISLFSFTFFSFPLLPCFYF